MGKGGIFTTSFKDTNSVFNSRNNSLEDENSEQNSTIV
jgi:hypothetical protein